MATISRRNKKRISKYLKYKSNIFYSLAPKESDNYDKYKEAFKFALNHNGKSKKITNIAVTGPYASGKSSVIENVKNKFGTEKFITLSLTNFNSGNIENDNKIQENSITNKKIEEDLEAQLINQLIHKIDSKKIEDSRFLSNKKIDTSKLSYKVGTFIHALIISIIFICLIIVNINNETISKILFLKLDDIKIISINILFIVGSIYSLYFGYKMINLFKKKKILRKINIYGNEIELFTNDDDSIFDKYTDEILYLFKNAQVDYFIFEDIDRYEDVTIFKKLREINILLNEKLKREEKEYKPIKFIYLICDNMFTAEERTKFFDFIIPVVPYIHKGNAYDNLLTFFPDEINDERNKKFLIKVSLFIDNSRLIKNIANEYYIYNKFIKLQDRAPHTKFIKLLSLIIYKNLFPKDFNQLYFNKGYLAELFNKEEFAKDNELTLDNLKYKTIKECVGINEDSNKFFKAPKGYDYIYNGGYFNLIKFLVTNGYIDETYKDYMSAITENSLTYETRAFLQNIEAHNGKQFLYPLLDIKDKKHLNNLLLYMDNNKLKQIEILNIYLFESWYINNVNIQSKIINLFDKKEFLLFIIIFYEYICKDKDRYYKLRDDFFSDMEFFLLTHYISINEYRYNYDCKYRKIIDIDYYISKLYIDFVTYDDTAKIQNINEELLSDLELVDMDMTNNISYNIYKLKENICNSYDYIQCLNELNKKELFKNNENYVELNINEIIDKLEEQQVIFLYIHNVTDKKLLKIIVSKRMFQPTYDNIVHILKTEDNIIAYPNIEKIPYNSLIETKHYDLKNYVDNNITYFLKSYPEEIQTLEDIKLLNILYNSDKITEEDREELKTRFNIK